MRKIAISSVAAIVIKGNPKHIPYCKECGVGCEENYFNNMCAQCYTKTINKEK